jgi:hypothetical protein
MGVMSAVPRTAKEDRRDDRWRKQLRLSRAIAAVLRYDVLEWLDLATLQRMVRRRFHLPVALGDLLIVVLADTVRFELYRWQGSWWCRATYRHGLLA